MSRLAAVVISVTLAVGCRGIPLATTAGDAGGEIGPPDLSPPPTYATIFSALLDAGTPGHCATAGCHADPGHHLWLCGTNKESCYRGLVGVGLIDPHAPTHSLIADPENSPLSWINPNGPMPFDSPGANPTARAMIIEWVAAGAHED